MLYIAADNFSSFNSLLNYNVRCTCRCPGSDKCLPLYTLCDGVEDCQNGQDEACGGEL